MGSDALNCLDTWYEWPVLFELANVLVLHRPEAALTVPQAVVEKFGKPLDAPTDIARRSGGFYQLALSQFDISSSDIRDRLQGGRSIRYLVPNSVVNYIQAHQLYA
jgi:nicotinate-nucleotide adenylyltransferase